MRRSTKPLFIAVCLSLLSLQLSGVHVHTDDSGFVGAPETPFTHSHHHHEDVNAHRTGAEAVDHGDQGNVIHADDLEDAKDVSLLDLALNTFKTSLAMMALVLLLSLFPVIRTYSRFDFVYRVLSGRHTRWRPPLRAPPQPA